MGENSPNVVWHPGNVDRDLRAELTGGSGAVVWITGLSGSGKSTVGVELESQLVAAGRGAYLLDGDNIRHGLNGDLGFSEADRTENVRRVAEVAALFADAGMVAVVPLISPYRRARADARATAARAGVPFVEVFVDTPLQICEQRDPKGLYEKARAGELEGMTGIDDPYEVPESPELHLRPQDGSPAEQASAIARVLEDLERS